MALLALPGVSPLAAVGGFHTDSTPAEISVTLNATPRAGVAPLLVSLTVTVSPGNGTWLVWDFGDGTYWNGSASDHLAASHWYGAPGNYRANVLASTGSSNVSVSLTITVVPDPLTATASATPQAGGVPLNVTFSVAPRGGSETYLSYTWSFGDGTNGSGLIVAHEYRTPGAYRASVTVDDTVGESAQAVVWVNVSPAADAQSGATPSISASWPIVVGVGVPIGLVSIGLFAFWRRRRSSGPTPVPRLGTPAGGHGVSGSATEPDAMDGVTGADRIAHGQGSSGIMSTEPLAEVDRSFASAGVTAEAEAPPGPAGPGAPAPSAEARRTSHQLLVRLLLLGPMAPYSVPSRDRTQAGLAESLGVRRSSLSVLIRRLTAAGAVESETRHVQGENRRLRVYQLTSRGEEIARELRRRGVRPPDAGRPRQPERPSP